LACNSAVWAYAEILSPATNSFRRKSLFTDLAGRLQRVTAWVGGDVMLDDYILGSVSRISPEAPVPVVDVHTRKYVLGGAANVAANLAALGTRVRVTGLVGSDEAGHRLRGLLAGMEIDCTGLVDSGDRYTICKTRIVAGRQQIVRIDHEMKSEVPSPVMDAALASAGRCISEADVLILSDYAKGLMSEAFCAFAIAEGLRRRVPIVVDPKSEDFRKYRGCTVITPNLLEAGRATGIHIDSEAALCTAGRTLLEMLPGTNILITRGADGMTLFHAGQEPVTVPTVARQVYDVTGAGDTVVAALAAALGAGIGLRDAMKLANVAAGIVVDKPGTATATVAEMAAIYSETGEDRRVAQEQ
jgi:rfaE bifunctional protein kinase chain/domain